MEPGLFLRKDNYDGNHPHIASTAEHVAETGIHVAHDVDFHLWKMCYAESDRGELNLLRFLYWA